MTARLGITFADLFAAGASGYLLRVGVGLTDAQYQSGYSVGLGEGIERGFRRGVGAERAMGHDLDAIREEARSDGFIAGLATGTGAVPPVVAVTAPTVSIVSPTPGVAPGSPGGFPVDWATARLTPIVVDIDGANLTFTSLVARYPLDNVDDADVLERVVYRRGAIRTGFSPDSTATQVTATKLRISVLPVGGWPSARSIAEISFAIDAVAGGVLSDAGAS